MGQSIYIWVKWVTFLWVIWVSGSNEETWIIQFIFLKKQSEIQSVCEYQIIKISEENSVSLVLEIFLKE